MSSVAKIPPKAGIEQDKIDRIKTTVDMIALAEAKGVHLKKNGRGWFGLCPFHNDKKSFPFHQPKNQPMAVLWLRQGWRRDPVY